jgi:Protein of unknown function (DUF1501)
VSRHIQAGKPGKRSTTGDVIKAISSARSPKFNSTVFLIGTGVKPGVTVGETDDFSHNIARDPVSVFDLNAAILHCLGIDHTRLTYKYQGHYFRLADVHGDVVRKILA